MSYSYRLARIEDLPAIVAIYNSTVASRLVTADLEPISVESRLEWFNQHHSDKYPLWVVEDSHQTNPLVIAWMSFSSFYGRPAYSGTVELSIYIHEDWRGKGLGKYLLTQAIQEAPARNIHTLLGFIFGCNKPSLGLFESLGFEEWAHLPRVANLDGNECDLIILGKRVSE